MTPYGVSVIVSESPIIRITKGTTNIYFNTIMLRFTLLMIFTECVLLYIILTCIVPLDSNHLIFTRGRSCISNPFASIFYLAIMVSEIKKKKDAIFFVIFSTPHPQGYVSFVINLHRHHYLDWNKCNFLDQWVQNPGVCIWARTAIGNKLKRIILKRTNNRNARINGMTFHYAI
jgi:hypothetical protein